MPPSAAAVSLSFNPADLFFIAPEILLTVWGLFVLVVDFGLLRRSPNAERRRHLGRLSLLGTLLALGSALVTLSPGSIGFESSVDLSLFYGTLAGDAATISLNVAVLCLLAMVIGLSMSWSFTEHWGEYYALLLWASVGMMFLIAAEELLTLFLTLETMTLCLYIMAAFEKTRRRSAEGGLKYFVYGSVSSALFLFGLSLIYGLTGTTRLEAVHQALMISPGSMGLAGNVAGATAVLLLMVGFGFKVAAVPFHQWAPDAYEGAPAPVTAWIAAGSKIASFVALTKVMVHALGSWANGSGSVSSPGWVGVLAVIAALSMTYGNFAALAQRNLKRMLAYSSIAHAGYILVGVVAAAISKQQDQAVGSVLFYLVVYGFTTVGAFAVAVWLAKDKASDEIDDLNGLGYRAPGLAVCIVLLMLSLIGMPPLAGFAGKAFMFMEALDAGEPGKLTLTWLVGLGFLNSVVSAFYYVRVLKAMFLRPATGQPLGSAPLGVRCSVVLATVVTVVFGLYATPLLGVMKRAAGPLLAQGTSTQGSSDTGPSSKSNRFATQADPNFKIDPVEQMKKRQELIKNLRQSRPGG